MSDVQTDILVVGGGLAGLTAAIAFANAGFQTLCVDPSSGATSEADPDADFRSAALLQPSRALLEEIGAWRHLAEGAMPLATMRMIDASGSKASERVSRDFNASDISDDPFGWNLPNWRIRQGLQARAAECASLDLRYGLSLSALWPQTARVRARLSDGTSVIAKLIVGADGKQSFVREALDIGVSTTDFGQSALAFGVHHPIPHGNVSSEIHLRGGPFTLVPLPDTDDKPTSAVVWMEDAPRAQELAKMPVEDFETEMSARSGHLLGPLTLRTKRTLWPITSQVAKRFSGPRSVLIAEAAHAMPPIGAQGLNTSIKDVSVLLGLLAKYSDPGDPKLVQAYDRARQAEVRLRMGGVGLLNRVSQSSASLVQVARAFGISQLHDLAPVRRAVMKLGMGTR